MKCPVNRVSIKDIAESLGVSSATVSLVLNDKKGARISKEMAAKVRDKAEEMNYRPNAVARSLRTGVTKTLGLIVADISNPFFARLARYMENFAAKKGYHVMFGSSDESAEKFEKLVDLFIDKNVDGLVVAPPQEAERVLMQLVRRRIPTVSVDRTIQGIPVSSVEINNEVAAYTLTDNLIKRGCRKIGFVAYNISLPNISKRYDGYCAALRSHSMMLDEDLVCFVDFENFDQKIEEGVKSILKKGVDSFVFATNRVGIQSLLVLKETDKYKKLKYASIDDADEYKLSNIDIICIDQPIEQISERALKILFNHIEDEAYDQVESVILQAKLVP